MDPHLCPLLATFCINTPNSSYSCVLQWSFGQFSVIQCHSCFFWYSFPSNSSSQSTFFFLLPISASLCLSAYLFFVAYRFGDKLFFFFLRVMHLVPLQTHFSFGSAIVLTGFTPSFLESIYLWTQELVSSVSESFCGMP